MTAWFSLKTKQGPRRVNPTRWAFQTDLATILECYRVNSDHVTVLGVERMPGCGSGLFLPSFA